MPFHKQTTTQKTSLMKSMDDRPKEIRERRYLKYKEVFVENFKAAAKVYERVPFDQYNYGCRKHSRIPVL